MKRANSGLITARLLCAFSHSVTPPAKPMMGYGERSQHALLRVSGRVRDADLRVETAAELAVQSAPQAGQGRALGVLGSRSLRLVFRVKILSAGIWGGFRLPQGALGVLDPLSQQPGLPGLQDSDPQQFDRPVAVAGG